MVSLGRPGHGSYGVPPRPEHTAAPHQGDPGSEPLMWARAIRALIQRRMREIVRDILLHCAKKRSIAARASHVHVGADARALVRVLPRCDTLYAALRARGEGHLRWCCHHRRDSTHRPTRRIAAALRRVPRESAARFPCLAARRPAPHVDTSPTLRWGGAAPSVSMRSPRDSAECRTHFIAPRASHARAHAASTPGRGACERRRSHRRPQRSCVRAFGGECGRRGCTCRAWDFAL